MSNHETINIRHATHDNVPPLIDENSTVLILGSMLSPKSAQAAFYYAHPQNRFWRVLFALFDCEYSTDKETRIQLALSHRVALWDVINSCNIVGASDNTITDVVYNDIDGLLARYPVVTRIFTTGGKAHELLMRYNRNINNPIISAATRLPSTSPQNCKVSLDKLIAAYSVIYKHT
ncbi:MAG: DNA-deoxyinosine glycosylase [Clostridiales bacterium]|nr:DNA-deoxyinosine glycosylase [Clostridiales bacterium]